MLVFLRLEFCLDPPSNPTPVAQLSEGGRALIFVNVACTLHGFTDVIRSPDGYQLAPGPDFTVDQSGRYLQAAAGC